MGVNTRILSDRRNSAKLAAYAAIAASFNQQIPDPASPAPSAGKGPTAEVDFAPVAGGRPLPAADWLPMAGAARLLPPYSTVQRRFYVTGTTVPPRFQRSADRDSRDV